MLTSFEDSVAVELGRRYRFEDGRRGRSEKDDNNRTGQGSDEGCQVQGLLVGPEKSKRAGEGYGDGDIRGELREGKEGEEPGLGSRREQASFGLVTCGLAVLSLGAIIHAYSREASLHESPRTQSRSEPRTGFASI